MPEIPDEYFRDFVRGYFDGDGSVWAGTVHSERKVGSKGISTRSISSCKSFLQSLREELAKQTKMGKGGLSARDRSFRLQYSVKDSVLLYEFMYDNLSNGLFLERKKNTFEEFIRMKKKVSK